MHDEDSASSENGWGNLLSDRELDVVSGELDVWRTDEDVIDVEVVRGAVEVERYEVGWVALVSETAFE